MLSLKWRGGLTFSVPCYTLTSNVPCYILIRTIRATHSSHRSVLQTHPTLCRSQAGRTRGRAAQTLRSVLHTYTQTNVPSYTLTSTPSPTPCQRSVLHTHPQRFVLHTDPPNWNRSSSARRTGGRAFGKGEAPLADCEGDPSGPSSFTNTHIQGYLAHKKTPPPSRTTAGP